MRLASIAAVLCLSALAASALAGEPEIVSVQRIWNEAPHNAFTDLIRFQDQWFCTFREAEAHVGGDGRLRVLVSRDGEDWESAASLAEQGIDLRDPKLCVTPDGKLMILAGGSVYGGTKVRKGMQPRVAFSHDGRQWTPTRRVLEEGHWLWRITWHDGRAYGASFFQPSKGLPGAPPESDGQTPDWGLKLVVSDNGVDFRTITQLPVSGRPNETTLRFLQNGELLALVRRELGDQVAWLGSSRTPFKDWSWRPTKMRVGGPNFIELPDGALWAGTRMHSDKLDLSSGKGPKTVLARLSTSELVPALVLPSGGDSSYPGLVWHDGLLWMSYYSSHEGKSGIYLAKIKLPNKDAAAE